MGLFIHDCGAVLNPLWKYDLLLLVTEHKHVPER